MQRLMTHVARAVTGVSLVLSAACTTSPDRVTSITAPVAADQAAASVAAPITFNCVDQGGGRIYAIYNARGRLVGNQPMNARVFRPYVGDTLSRRPVSMLMSPATYPGFPQYNVWNVTGGPAVGTTNYFFLLFPKVLPGPGGIFPAELHVQFNKGQYGWNQSIEMCTVQ